MRSSSGPEMRALLRNDAIALDHARGAGALAVRIAVMAAWTGVHRRDQHKTGRERQAAVRAADGDGLVFHRLAHHFQHAAVELRQLVEKEHAAMRQADLAGPRPVAAPNKPGIAVRVNTKSLSAQSSLCTRIHSSCAVSSFFTAEVAENAEKTALLATHEISVNSACSAVQYQGKVTLILKCTRNGELVFLQ